LVIRVGTFFGDTLGGVPFDDSATCSLTLVDRLVSVNVSWAYDTLCSISFTYSNGATTQHGFGDKYRPPINSGLFTLLNTESFNGVTVYRGVRDIINTYSPNGTDLIVGITFFTNKARQSSVFGSSDGVAYSDSYSDYTLAYARGRAYAFLDGVQFIWTKNFEQSSSAMIVNV
jgi:hypothetical protein